MSGLHIETPSRLHFGLLGWGHRTAPREFGGVGLMVDRPGSRRYLELQPSQNRSGSRIRARCLSAS